LRQGLSNFAWAGWDWSSSYLASRVAGIMGVPIMPCLHGNFIKMVQNVGGIVPKVWVWFKFASTEAVSVSAV
jgi:hypothetical protein